MKKNSLYYFKRPLILIIPTAVFIIVKELLKLEISSFSDLMMLFAKGLFVGLGTSIILGFLNIFAKKESLYKKKTV